MQVLEKYFHHLFESLAAAKVASQVTLRVSRRMPHHQTFKTKTTTAAADATTNAFAVKTSTYTAVITTNYLTTQTFVT